jgi:hypothetical protein
MTFEERIQQTLGQLVFSTLIMQDRMDRLQSELNETKTPSPEKPATVDVPN